MHIQKFKLKVQGVQQSHHGAASIFGSEIQSALAGLPQQRLGHLQVGIGVVEMMFSVPTKCCCCFRSLKEEEDFVDVTLSCEESQYTAHKVVLSACSPYFRKLLKVRPQTSSNQQGQSGPKSSYLNIKLFLQKCSPAVPRGQVQLHTCHWSQLGLQTCVPLV